MRVNQSILILIVLLVLPIFSFSQKNEKKKTDEELGVVAEPVYVEGIVYSLPRVGFNILLETRETSFIPGPYAAFAEKYMGLKNVKTNVENVWEITSINIEPFSEPDPNAVYKAMNTEPSQIAQLSNGIIIGIKTEGQHVPNKIIGGSLIASTMEPPKFTDLSSDEFYISALDPQTGAENFSNKSNEEKARDAADYIMRLRQKRTFKILSPSDVVPEDGNGYEAFVKEAQRLEKEYVSLFIGKSTSKKHQFNITYIPVGNDLKNEVLFRFSDEKGVVSKSDISGKPIMLSLTKDADFLKTIGQLKKSDNPNAGVSGIYYRIPAMTEITITDGLSSLYSGRVNLPQSGVVAPMPEKLLDGNYAIQFDPETGTILEVKNIK